MSAVSAVTVVSADAVVIPERVREQVPYIYICVHPMGEKFIAKDVVAPSDIELASFFNIDVMLECLRPIQAPISIAVVYSATGNSAEDQVLGEYNIGPLQQGVNKLKFDAVPGPNLGLIKPEDHVGMSLLLIRFSLDTSRQDTKENAEAESAMFAQVGWFMSQQESTQELVQPIVPNALQMKLTRSFIETPMVCKFDIDWNCTSDTVSGRPLEDVFPAAVAVVGAPSTDANVAVPMSIDE